MNNLIKIARNRIENNHVIKVQMENLISDYSHSGI